MPTTSTFIYILTKLSLCRTIGTQMVVAFSTNCHSVSKEISLYSIYFSVITSPFCTIGISHFWTNPKDVSFNFLHQFLTLKNPRLEQACYKKARSRTFTNLHFQFVKVFDTFCSVKINLSFPTLLDWSRNCNEVNDIS